MNTILKQKYTYRLRDGLIIPWKCAKASTLFLICSHLANGFIPLLQAAASALLVNSLTALSTGNRSFYDVLFPSVMLLLVLTHNYIGQGLLYFTRARLTIQLEKRLRPELLKHQGAMPYPYVEDSEIQNLSSRVTEDLEQRISASLETLLSILALIIKITGTLAILAFYVKWLVAIILLLAIPFCFLALKAGHENYDTSKYVTSSRRKYQYLQEVLHNRDYVQERTLFQYSTALSVQWDTLHEYARTIQLQMKKKWFFRMKGSGLLTSVFCLIILFLLLIPTLDYRLSLGLYMALVNLLFELIGDLSWQLTAYLDSLAQHGEFYNELTCFMALDSYPELLQKSLSPFPFSSLEFRNVSFRYPNSEKKVLDHLSFRLESNKHYAFVGANGCGKTTIIKLMTGLYRDYEGEILLNDVPLTAYEPATIYSIFAPIFQDYARYHLTARENISLGNLMQAEGNISSFSSIQKEIHLDLEQLDIPLGKTETGGVDLSSGQWQKLAIARGLINPAPVCLLDEPTASLDPVSENEIYKNFLHLTQNRTAVFISHRLASTRYADKIFVLEEGRIQEQGTHEHLMEQNGLYRRMYDSQKGWYL